jgi:hypothetical protein
MKGRILAALLLGAAGLAACWTPAALAASTAEECDVPQSYVETDLELQRVLAEVKDKHRLDISVIGTGSSALSAADAAHFAYPARLGDLLKAQVGAGTEIKVTAHTQSREITSAMVAGMDKIIADDKPALVIWQTGTADAMSGIEPDDFRASLDEGVQKIQAADADAILMNMQYSPRTESMLDVSAYADVMRLVAQQHNAPLFDRLGLMHYWNDQGTFDLYTPTKKYDIARRVHECIGRALASLIINAAHLDALKIQTTH